MPSGERQFNPPTPYHSTEEDIDPETGPSTDYADTHSIVEPAATSPSAVRALLDSILLGSR